MSQSRSNNSKTFITLNLVRILPETALIIMIFCIEAFTLQLLTDLRNALKQIVRAIKPITILPLYSSKVTLNHLHVI